MTENLQPPVPAPPSGERKLLKWILVLQIAILVWLAKNYFDGALRHGPNNPPVVATRPDGFPSLDPTGRASAASFFSFLPQLTITRQTIPQPRPPRHPADRMRAEMERMMAEANQLFASSGSLFERDAHWAQIPASPTMNLRELPDGYELAIAMPDVAPEALDIRLEGRLLSVSMRQDQQTLHSTSQQRFHSRVLLPGPVDTDASLHITNLNDRICIRIPKPTRSSP